MKVENKIIIYYAHPENNIFHSGKWVKLEDYEKQESQFKEEREKIFEYLKEKIADIQTGILKDDTGSLENDYYQTKSFSRGKLVAFTMCLDFLT